MRSVVLFLIAVAAVAFSPAVARADDIAAASRSVVRVVVVVFDDYGGIIDFGHGSGFAISRTRVVTNAHVLDQVRRYPRNAAIGVVPSEGEKALTAGLASINTFHDLAVLELEDGTLPPLPLFTGAVEDGLSVVALGYPGSVDLATARGARDFITPSAPTRSTGNISNRRDWHGTDTLLHTAPIGRGNSGGPLVDECGRVIGVNTFITRGAGETPFGFAVSVQELSRFLRSNGIPFTTVSSECVSIEERMREERAREAREEQLRTAEAEARVIEAQQAREEARRQAEADQKDLRENMVGLSLLLGAFGLVALGGAGILLLKDKHGLAYASTGLGVTLLVAAGIVFLNRPTRSDLKVPKPLTEIEKPALALTGSATCRLVPERSRVTVSSTQDVPINWAPSGCMNGRTQYVQTGDVWSRTLVPNEDQIVSVLEFSPTEREYIASRYLLSLEEMEQARAIRKQSPTPGCTPSRDDLAAFETQQHAIRNKLPALPHERLVYVCSKSE